MVSESIPGGSPCGNRHGRSTVLCKWIGVSNAGRQMIQPQHNIQTVNRRAKDWGSHGRPVAGRHHPAVTGAKKPTQSFRQDRSVARPIPAGIARNHRRSRLASSASKTPSS
jgi:hypothetical protein